MSSAIVTHAPGGGGIMGPAAFCGRGLEEGAILRMSQVSADVDCVVCLELMGGHVCGRDYDSSCDGCAFYAGDTGGEF